MPIPQKDRQRVGAAAAAGPPSNLVAAGLFFA
jgi:hypothetical protein